MLTIEPLPAASFSTYRADLIGLLQDAVNGGASVSFIAPLSAETAAAYWSKVEAEVARAERVVLIARQEDRLVGSVQLALNMPPNGQHRADVQKLLVLSAHRQRGIARALMTALEQTARQAGRSLLVLDTQRGSVADALYEKCGYTRAGIIPNYALSGDGKVLIDTVFFYRILDPS